MNHLRRLAEPWLAYLIAGLAAVGVYYWVRDTLAQAFLYDGIGASSAAAVVAGTLLHRPPKRLSWFFFAAGLLAFSVGDVIFNLYADVWNKPAPVPSVADAFYLAGYPLIAVGVALLFLGFGARQRRVGLIDAALLTVAFALAQWVFLMKDIVHSPGSTSSKVVALAYPAMDVILLSGLAIFSLSSAWRTIAYRFLAASLVLLLVADEIYGTNPDAYSARTWLDSGWLLSYVLWGVAALHPSMTALSERMRARRPRLTRARLALLAATLLAAPAVLMIQRITGGGVESLAIVICATLLSVLVLARLAGLVHDAELLRREERAARREVDMARRLLEEQNKALREADQLKDEFVALISHDLRTPLTSIMGYLELALESEELPETERGYLEVVDRNSQRLLHLVNDLLFVARLEAGEMDIRFDEVDLSAVVRQALEEAEPRARAKEIALQSDTDSVPPISADRGRMFQLLDNLVGNAIKFTPAGGKVAVRLSREGDLLRLEVEDSGIGIAPDDQHRLFERFFRASNTRDAPVPGTGLGLYIARAIVEAHGGRIAVESSVGAGTCFCVELPLTR